MPADKYKMLTALAEAAVCRPYFYQTPQFSAAQHKLLSSPDRIQTPSNEGSR